MKGERGTGEAWGKEKGGVEEKGRSEGCRGWLPKIGICLILTNEMVIL